MTEQQQETQAADPGAREVVQGYLLEMKKTIDDLVDRCTIRLPVDYQQITPAVVQTKIAEIRNLSIEVTKCMALLQRALRSATFQQLVAAGELRAAERRAMDQPRVQAGSDANARKARAEAIADHEAGRNLRIAQELVSELTSNLEVIKVVHGELAQARQDIRSIIDTWRVQVNLEVS